MGDLEITKACADAMGLEYHTDEDPDVWYGAICTYNSGSNMWTDTYNPLVNDAQAMALVKKFGLNIGQTTQGVKVFTTPLKGGFHEADDQDLNRAICTCVANMKREAK